MEPNSHERLRPHTDMVPSNLNCRTDVHTGLFPHRRHGPERSDDLWLHPGSAALSVFFPDVDRRAKRSKLTDREVQRQLELSLQKIAIGAMADLSVHSPSSVDDMTQELFMRIATMNAAEQFDPTRASPRTFLHGISRTLVREQFHRRERPVAIPGDAMDRMSKDGNQLDRAVRDDLRQELKHWLNQLSPGELRAIVHTYGPILDYSPPVGPRRRLKNPDALPRAIEALKKLIAQRSEQ